MNKSCFLKKIVSGKHARCHQIPQTAGRIFPSEDSNSMQEEAMRLPAMKSCCDFPELQPNS